MLKFLSQTVIKTKISIQELAELIGKLVAACPACPYGWVHSKILERENFKALRRNNQNYKDKLTITSYMQVDLYWWIQTLFINKGMPILTNKTYRLEIFPDASSTGWGAFCDGHSTNGFWNSLEASHHINYLELVGALNAVNSFAQSLSNCYVILRVGNTTAVSCINRMGSVRYSKLNSVVRE